MRELADLLLGDTASRPMSVEKGVINSVEGSTLTLRLGGSTVEIPGVQYVRTGVTLAANDVVWVIRQGAGLLVLGKAA